MDKLIELYLSFVGFVPKQIAEYRLNRAYYEAFLINYSLDKAFDEAIIEDLARSGKRISIRKLGQVIGVKRPRSLIGKQETRRLIQELGFALKKLTNPKLATVSFA